MKKGRKDGKAGFDVTAVVQDIAIYVGVVCDVRLAIVLARVARTRYIAGKEQSR